MNKSLRILCVEGSPSDFSLIQQHLKKYLPQVELNRVTCEADLKTALEDGVWDVVLSAFAGPGFDFKDVLQMLLPWRDELPVILVSDRHEQEQAVQLLSQGIWDFILKDNLTRLVPTIERSVKDVENYRARRKAELALQASEERFRAIFENNPEGVLVVDATEKRILMANQSMCRILGYRLDELSQLGVIDIHPQINQPRVHLEFDDLARKERHFAKEIPVLRKDGSIFLADISASNFEVGGQRFMVGLFHDITERKFAEDALEAEATRRRILVDASWDGVVVLDQDAAVVEANRRFAEMLGYSADEVRHLHVWDWDFQWSREMVLDSIRSAPAGGYFVTQHRRKDGSVFDVEISTNYAELKGQRLFFCVCRDITERKQATEALAQREEIFSIIVGQAMDAITVVDVSNGRFVEFNTVAHEGLGYTREEFAAFSIADIQGEHTPETIQQNLTAIRLQGELSFESKHRHRDGSLRDVRISVRKLSIRDREYAAAVWTDITERKRAEQRNSRDALRTEFLLQLHQTASQMTDRELYDHVLERAVRLTESSIGFFHQVSEDQNSILLTTWNRGALENCTANYDSHYPVNTAGNWVDCIREQRPVVYNDYATSPNQKGLPEGHAPVKRFMSIPVIRDQKVRIIFGVGNKATDYDDSDVSQLQIVANELHKIMTQRAAQNQLRQLSQAVAQSTTSVVIMDTAGAIEYVNPRFTQVVGYFLDEVQHRSFRLLKPDTVSMEDEKGIWGAILDGKEGWHGELQIRKKNGELYWESASVSPIVDAMGQITHFVAVMEDIAERKRLELFREALLSLGNQLNSTRDAASVGRSVIGIADRLWRWDAARLDVIDAGTQQVSSIFRVGLVNGKRFELPPLGVIPLTEQMQRVIVRGPELQSVAMEGLPEAIPFETEGCQGASMMCVPIHREMHIVGFLSICSYSTGAYTQEDLKIFQALADYCGGALDRIRSEESLRESEGRYRNLVETTFDWIWETDANGRYTYASPKVKDLLGYAPEEVIGKSPFDLMTEREAHRVSALFREIAAAQKPFSGLENANRHKDGHLVILESSGVPVVDESGRLKAYRGMDRDISERKRLEEQFRQAQKLEAVGQLAGGVAHDFNNILAAIMMQLDLLRLSPALDDEMLQGLDELGEQAQRAAGLTRQLLMFSRRSVLTTAPLDLNEVVENLLKMLRRLIGEQIDLRFDGKTGLPLVEADAGMIDQVLLNLVVNARDAMPKGGRITISTFTVDLDEADCVMNPDRRSGSFVCLAASDTGMGMDSYTMEKIFEPFFTTKEAGKGTGLGLATVHGIVAQHKGWIEVESTLGKGSTFKVVLPALIHPVDLVLPKESRVPLRGGSETILFVEDDTSVRQMVDQALRALGYSVHTAKNGREAMALWNICGADVDLLFTDMVMPEGMSGMDLVERLRMLKPGLKAIISSGYSTEIVQDGVLDSADVTYLPKPYEARALAEAVWQCLHARK